MDQVRPHSEKLSTCGKMFALQWTTQCSFLPQKCRVTSGCLSFEDHLVDSILTTGEGTVHALQMEHDEDTSTTQSTSSAMTSGDSI